jgi:hypothetical protein
MPFLTRRWSFHDTTLSTYVRNAYHAMAIDERRGPFKPTLWERKAPVPGQTLEQVWFSGVHSDVGGGYRDTALSEIPLLWMVERASEHGLVFEPDHFVPTYSGIDEDRRHLGEQIAPNALGQIGNSLKSFYLALPRYRRPLAADGGSAASSAKRRRDGMPGYDSPELVKYLDGGGPLTTVEDGGG